MENTIDTLAAKLAAIEKAVNGVSAALTRLDDIMAKQDKLARVLVGQAMPTATNTVADAPVPGPKMRTEVRRLVDVDDTTLGEYLTDGWEIITCEMLPTAPTRSGTVVGRRENLVNHMTVNAVLKRQTAEPARAPVGRKSVMAAPAEAVGDSPTDEIDTPPPVRNPFTDSPAPVRVAEPVNEGGGLWGDAFLDELPPMEFRGKTYAMNITSDEAKRRGYPWQVTHKIEMWECDAPLREWREKMQAEYADRPAVDPNVNPFTGQPYTMPMMITIE